MGIPIHPHSSSAYPMDPLTAVLYQTKSEATVRLLRHWLLANKSLLSLLPNRDGQLNSTFKGLSAHSNLGIGRIKYW